MSIEQLFGRYEEAFLPPALQSWGYLPAWNRELDDTHINGVHDDLIAFMNRHGPTADGLFLLAIIYKHCNQQERYRELIRETLRLDSNHLEASIATRDLERYADPLFFPRWDDFRTGTVAYRRDILNHTSGPGLFIEQVRVGCRIVPAIVVKKRASEFRHRIDKDTYATVVVDVVGVVPGCSALMFMMPIIFDDQADPYWGIAPLVAHQKGLVAGKVPIIHMGPSVTLPASDIARRSCELPGQCALLVVDEKNHPIFSRLIEYDDDQNARMQEIQSVISILADKSMDLQVWQQHGTLLQNCYSTKVSLLDGTKIRVPAGRSKTGNNAIFPVRAEGRRLTTETHVNDAVASKLPPLYDVFVSHAHSDQRLVAALVGWLTEIWPKIRIYHTSPEGLERFETEPTYFVRDLQRSRSMLVVGTKAGLMRPAVQFELGAAKEMEVIVVFAGDGDESLLSEIMEKDLYLKVDPTKTVNIDDANASADLAARLSASLEFELPKQLPILEINSDECTEEEGNSVNRIDVFRQDFFKMFRSATPGSRDAQKAVVNLVVEQYFQKLDTGDRKPFAVMVGTFSPAYPLALILSTSSTFSESQVREIFGRIPALIDSTLYSELCASESTAISPDEGLRWRVMSEVANEMINSGGC